MRVEFAVKMSRASRLATSRAHVQRLAWYMACYTIAITEGVAMESSRSSPVPTEMQGGAVPPTGGVTPEDAPPAEPAPAEARSARDDLVDGIDLIRRAARKALGSLDPRVEQAAERAVEHLRQLDADAAEMLRKGGRNIAQFETIVNDFGREVSSLVERIATKVEAAAKADPPPRDESR
jgi:hypothetical protein